MRRASRLADQVTQGGQGVVVLVERGLGRGRLAGRRCSGTGSASASRLGQRPCDDSQPAVFQAGGDGGDAGPQVVVALADLEAGAAQFGPLVGAGGVGVPDDVARAGAAAWWLSGCSRPVVLAGQPEDVVAVEDAPDGGEGVAEAEVDAADAGAGWATGAADRGERRDAGRRWATTQRAKSG